MTHESHASEQAARQKGRTHVRGGGNHSWHSTRGTYTSVTYPLGVAAGDDGGTETSFLPAAARSYVIRTSSRPRCK